MFFLADSDELQCKCYLPKLCNLVGGFVLIIDPPPISLVKIHQSCRDWGSPLLSAEGAARAWQLFGNTTWNMLAACQGTLSRRMGWEKRHHLPFSLASTSGRSDWSAPWHFCLPQRARGLQIAFTLLSLSCFCSSYLSSPLLALWSRFRLSTENKGDVVKKKRLNYFLLLS